MSPSEIAALAASVTFGAAFWYSSKRFMGADYGLKAFVLFTLAAVATIFWVHAFGMALLWGS
jgi:hypothetical protein